MSLLSKWNTIKSNMLSVIDKCESVHGGTDIPESSTETVDTTSEAYLKSLFEYSNQWNCTKRTWAGSRTTPTRTHITQYLVNGSMRKSYDTSADWAWGDNYVGVRECYVYCSQDYTLSVTAFTDDEGSVWLNGSQVTTLATCEKKTFNMSFKKGLNHVEIAFSEQSGGDAAYMTPNLASQSFVKWMYARYKLM